jgi:signal transduction histidine kinase
VPERDEPSDAAVLRHNLRGLAQTVLGHAEALSLRLEHATLREPAGLSKDFSRSFEKSIEAITEAAVEMLQELENSYLVAGFASDPEALQLRLSKVDLKEAVERVLAHFKRTIRRRSIQVHLALSPAVAFADAALVDLILINLIDFVLKGSRISAAIRVTVHASAKAGHLRIDAEPFGGIDPRAMQGIEVAQLVLRAHDVGNKLEAEYGHNTVTLCLSLPLNADIARD